jgi:beta-galactosidase
MENYGLVEQKDSAERPRWVREYADFPDDFDNQNTIWRCRRCWGDGAMAESVNRQLNRFDINPEATMYIDVYNDKRLCGYGVWPAIAHNRGYHINPCWGGHLDLFRVPKSSYYFVRSQMDREEAGDVLYVAHWWAETSPEDVAVYSNAERVQLFWNDQLIAEQGPDDIAVKHPPFTFKNIRGRYKTRARSSITAKALVGGKVVAEQKVIAPGVPHHMELKADFMEIPLVADGSDIVAVRCYMKDLDGTVVPLTGDVHPIFFEVEGEGEIVGDAAIGANPITPEAGIATVLVRATKKAGDIKIKARMYWPQMFYRGIQPVELTIQSIPAEG